MNLESKNRFRKVSITDIATIMNEYTLNDITFTTGKVEELPLDSHKDENWNMDAIDKQSKATWIKLEQYEHEYEEQKKTGSLRM